MNFNELTKHINELNELEQVKHHQRAKAALARIKELRERTRTQQETTASEDSTRRIS
jgi:Tfp pilus assembly protein PilE